MGRTSTGGGPKVILANPLPGEEGAWLSLKRRKESHKSLKGLDLCSPSEREGTRRKQRSGKAMQQRGEEKGQTAQLGQRVPGSEGSTQRGAGAVI